MIEKLSIEPIMLCLNLFVNCFQDGYRTQKSIKYPFTTEKKTSTHYRIDKKYQN